jgi:hypothetical protein
MKKIMPIYSGVIESLYGNINKLNKYNLEENLSNQIIGDVEMLVSILNDVVDRSKAFTMLMRIYCNANFGITFHDLCKSLAIEPLDTKCYERTADTLVSKVLLAREIANNHYSNKIPKTFDVEQLLSYSFADSVLIREQTNLGGLNIFEFIYKISLIFKDRANNEIDEADFVIGIQDLEIEQYDNLKLIHTIVDLVTDGFERFLFYAICYNEFTLSGRMRLNELLTIIYRCYRSIHIKEYEIFNQKGVLFELGLVQVDDDVSSTECILKLSDEGKELLYGEQSIK